MVFNCGLPACKTDALSGAYETPLDMMSRAQQGITVFNFSTLILPVLPKKKGTISNIHRRSGTGASD
jgi:hypothetical protein